MIRLKNILFSLVFIFAISFIFASGLHSLEEPLERDLTTYGYIGHALLSGENLYTDLWDHKPPGIHIAFALSELIWGYGQRSIAFLWVVLSILTTIFIYLILDKISDWKAALIAVIFWVLSSNSAYLQANQPNTEIFLNLFTLIAIWALVQHAHPTKKDLHITGWAMAIATMFKPVAIFVLLTMLIYALLQQYYHTRDHRIQHYFAPATRLLYPVPVLWLGMFIYALIMGRFQEYWDIIIVYNSQYSGNTLMNIWAFFRNPVHIFSQSLYGIWILTLMGYAWLFVGSHAKNRQIHHSLFILLFLGVLFEIGSIGSIGRNYAHYYQTLLPILTINASLLIVYIFDESFHSRHWRQFTSALLLLIALGTLINSQIEFFRFSPIEVSYQKYKRQFIDAWEMGLEIKTMTNPDETIYYWGSESGVYYYSQRNSASGIFYNLPLKEKKNKRVDLLMTQLLGDLRESPPAIFIWNTKEGKFERNPLYEFVMQEYHLLWNRSHFQVYVRNI